MLDWLSEPDFWEWLGLLAVVAIVLYRRVPAWIGKALDARAAAIAKELESVSRLRQEAETLLVSYREKVQSAQGEAAIILSETRAEAERFAAEAREQMTTQIARRAQQAQERIAQAEANAMAEIRALAADAAAAAAGKLIAAHMDDAKADALIAASLKELPAKLN
jgi:F-type H+-transporting ATPase subunit b